MNMRMNIISQNVEIVSGKCNFKYFELYIIFIQDAS